MTHLDEKKQVKERCRKCDTILSKVRIGDEITYACKKCYKGNEGKLALEYKMKDTIAS